MKKIQISPSILSADFSQLGSEIKKLEEGGADLIHVDVMDGHFVPNLTIGPPVIKNLRESINLIKKFGKKVGVSLNPKTKIITLIDEIENIDLVLVMSVNPGFGGQKFMPEVLDKIKELKKIKDKNQYHFDIEVDGGINFSNSKIVLEAGADILVSGTTVFNENDGDIKTNIEKLKSM